MRSFCYIIGTASEFRTRFENPIRRGRDAGGSDLEVQQAQEKLQELNQIVNRCIIRRTQALLTKYLPVKSKILKKKFIDRNKNMFDLFS